MSKLQKAINHFSKRHVESNTPDYYILAEALEEIRDHIFADKKPAPEEQPATFEPWDCVKLKPGTTWYKAWGDVECVLGDQFEDGDWRIFNPDNSEECLGYALEHELIFVRRLKPRAQAEPSYIGSVMTNAGKEPSNEDLLRAAGYTQKPSPFQVGDWVQNPNSGPAFKVDSIRTEDNLVHSTDQGGHGWSCYAERLQKIDPPAPRFTFGDRVRSSENNITSYQFIRYLPDGTHAELYCEEDNRIYDARLSILSLDTSAD